MNKTCNHLRVDDDCLLCMAMRVTSCAVYYEGIINRLSNENIELRRKIVVMDKLIHAVERDVNGNNKEKAKKDIKVLLKADRKFDAKLEKCDKEMKRKGKK